MKICFNEATTLKNSTLERDLELCESLGYSLIEIRLDKLKEYLTIHSVDDLAAFFSKARLKPYAFNALEFISFRDKAGRGDINDNLKFLCEIGSKIGCKKIVVVPTFDVGHRTVSEIEEETVRVLREMSAFAANYDVKLAFEFVGYPNCSVNTFGQALDIVNKAQRPNIGIVLDCFHFYAMGSRMNDIKRARPEQIFIFHIDDSEDLPYGAARDDARLWPGLGVVPLDGILAALREIGYSEMASVELFRPEYWEYDAEKTIRDGYEATVNVVSKYFPVE